MSFDEKKAIRQRRRKGVVGHSKKVRRRNRDPEGEEVIRIYVEDKIEEEDLSSKDLVPKEIDGIPTDVEAIGKVEAASEPKNKEKKRPLVAGFSIGNLKVSAGTLGWYFEKEGIEELFLGSNTHIFSDNLRPVCFEEQIVQPGVKDGGELPRIALHHWHAPLKISLNPINALWMVLVNGIFQVLGQEPPYDLTDSNPRQLDFAVALPREAYDCVIPGLQDFDDYCGIFFASSSIRSFFCKERYSREEGYLPWSRRYTQAQDGDLVHKVGRTTGYTTGSVLDDSVSLRVTYGGDWFNVIPFDDVVMTEKMIKGGDSGSAAWLYAVPE